MRRLLPAQKRREQNIQVRVELRGKASSLVVGFLRKKRMDEREIIGVGLAGNPDIAPRVISGCGNAGITAPQRGTCEDRCLISGNVENGNERVSV